MVPRIPTVSLLRLIAAALLLPFLSTLFAQSRPYTSTKKLKALIVDGQNNHDWKTTTPMLKRILTDTGLFAVDVSTSPPKKPSAPRLPKNPTPDQQAAFDAKMKSLPDEEAEYAKTVPSQWLKWRPNFAGYDVVISNYNGESWPESVRTAFEAFVKKGGGFVSYHAANNAFPEWPEYNAMIGVGGWGDRNEKSGPYLRLRENGWIRDTSVGPGGSHGPQHEFIVETRSANHPIMRGLPERWMHAKDELYDSLRGPAQNVEILASAFSSKSKENEPMLMVIPYGKGRVFHTTLGHAVDAVNDLGFQVTLTRGAEWAATGKVTQSAPKPGELTEAKAAVRVVVSN